MKDGVIPDGYKLTEVGVIPCDWEVKRLGEVSEINRGASPRPIDSPKWYSTQSNVGWVRIADVSEANGKILLKTKDYLSKQGISQSRFISQGSLIMSICATVGLPIITGIEVCIHDGFVGFDKISKDIDLEFLFYTLKELEKSFKSAGQVCSQSNLNSEIIRQYFITIPPLPEQKRIAKALSDIDELITALDKLITKKRYLKQGAMQQLLTGKTRLPGFTGAWDVKEIKELTLQLTNGFVGQATQHYTNSNDGVFYIQGFNVEENSFNLTGIKKVTSEFHRRNSRSSLREGDLLTIQTGEVGITTIVPKKLEGSNCHALIITRFKQEIIFPKFYSYYFNSSFYRNQLKEIETGTTMKHINVRDMAILQVLIPPLPEQKAIAQILTKMDEEIEALEKKRDKYKKIKQGMMSVLLTGRIRLM